MSFDFFTQVLRYAPLLCLLSVSCGVKGPPLPPLPSTPLEMEKLEMKTNPSPTPQKGLAKPS